MMALYGSRQNQMESQQREIDIRVFAVLFGLLLGIAGNMNNKTHLKFEYPALSGGDLQLRGRHVPEPVELHFEHIRLVFVRHLEQSCQFHIPVDVAQDFVSELIDVVGQHTTEFGFHLWAEIWK